jgi:hypothetical protein
MKNLSLCFFVVSLGMAAVCRAEEVTGSVSEPNSGKVLYRITFSVPTPECSDAVALRLMDENKALREENEVLRAQLALHGGRK